MKQEPPFKIFAPEQENAEMLLLLLLVVTVLLPLGIILGAFLTIKQIIRGVDLMPEEEFEKT